MAARQPVAEGIAAFRFQSHFFGHVVSMVGVVAAFRFYQDHVPGDPLGVVGMPERELLAEFRTCPGLLDHLLYQAVEAGYRLIPAPPVVSSARHSPPHSPPSLLPPATSLRGPLESA